jgi:hypothetical protein
MAPSRRKKRLIASISYLQTPQNTRHAVAESSVVALVGLALFIPFLSLQYDTNGLVEALAVESGELFHKNHLFYRLIGYAAYRGLQLTGHSTRAIVVLQVLNALCGALGLGLAYLTYKRATHNRPAALAGTVFIGCSFIYWLFSTDAAYITVAATFANASLAMLLCMNSPAGAVIAGALTAFSILTWQASIFLVPALAVLLIEIRRDLPMPARVRHVITYVATACLISLLSYTVVAFAQHGAMSVSSLVRWFTTYGEGGTLPMWGKWEAQRILIAAGSAFRSFVPTPLAVPLSQLNWTVQRGRIAVDLAIVGFAFLTLLAALKTHLRALGFLVAYLLFLPFIVWWDPFEPKWFLLPNVFLAGFFAAALAPWLRNRYVSSAILASVFIIAATNFITTIRPRHNDIGPDRRMAQCVAENMHANDLMMAAEWGWPDYLEYLYARKSLSLINNFPAVQDALKEVYGTAGIAYISDPNAYSDDHVAWLQSQSGIGRDDLNRLADAPAFSCYGRTIFSVRTSR